MLLLNCGDTRCHIPFLYRRLLPALFSSTHFWGLKLLHRSLVLTVDPLLMGLDLSKLLPDSFDAEV